MEFGIDKKELAPTLVTVPSLYHILAIFPRSQLNRGITFQVYCLGHSVIAVS